MPNEIKINCKLEEYAQLFNILELIKEGYETGDFSELFPHLDKDCILESQWVMIPNTGYEEVTDYLKGKGETIARDDVFPECTIVELVGDINNNDANVQVNGSDKSEKASVGLMYEAGKPCLLMEQTLRGETNGVIVDVKLKENGLVQRIDLCMPELFNYEVVEEHVEAYPANDITSYDDKDENLPISIKIGESFYGELYFFSTCASCEFDAYGEYSVPTKEWENVLKYWETFLSANDFDEALETLAGVDYDSGTVEKPEIARRFGEIGRRLWREKENSRTIERNLREWFDTYKDSYKYISFFGW